MRLSRKALAHGDGGAGAAGRRVQLERQQRGPPRAAAAPRGRADPGQVPAPVGRPVAVRRLLRGARPGLLPGPRARRAACCSAARTSTTSRSSRPAARTSGPPGSRTCSSRAKAARTSSRSPRSSSARAPGWPAFKAANITTPASMAGKKIGSWLGGNEPELFAALTKASLDPTKENIIKQNFDMSGLLKGDLDVAQAMIYNEYAQVLEAKNPATGQLYTPDDLNVIDFNDPAVGTAMLQDQIFATDKWLKTGNNADIATQVPAGDVQGLDLLPRQRPEVRRHRARQGLAARRQPPGLADERDQRADLAVAERHRPARQGALRPDDQRSRRPTRSSRPPRPRTRPAPTSPRRRSTRSARRSTPRARASPRARSRSRRAATSRS